MASEYRLLIAVNEGRDDQNRIVEIREAVETNYRDGRVKQLSSLFYRAMLASGYSPGETCAALSNIAQAGGMLPADDAQGGLFSFEPEGAH